MKQVTFIFLLLIAGVCSIKSQTADTLLPDSIRLESVDSSALQLDGTEVDSAASMPDTSLINTEMADSLKLDSGNMETGSDTLATDSLPEDLKTPGTEPDSSEVSALVSPDTLVQPKVRNDTGFFSRLYPAFSMAAELSTLNITRFPSNATSHDSRMGTGYNFMFNVGYNLNDQFQLETGLGYGSKAFVYTLDGLVFPSDIDPNEGVVSTSSGHFKTRFQEIQLPFILSWEAIKGMLSLRAGYEFQYQFGITYKNKIEYGNGSSVNIERKAPEGQFNLSPTLGIEYQYPIHEKWVLRIEPMVKVYGRFYDITIRKSQLYIIGLRVGLKLI